MADDVQLSKHLQQMIRDMQSTTRKMSETADKLSNSGIDEYLDHMKSLIESTGLISKKQLAYVKDIGSLSKVVEDLEGKFADVAAIEQKYQDQLEKKISDLSSQEALKKKFRNNATKQQAAVQKAIDDSTAARVKEAKVSEQMYGAILAGVPAIQREVDERSKNIGSLQKFRGEVDRLTDGYKKQIQSFFTLDTAVTLAKKAFFQSYDQMSRLSNRGMLGAFATINTIAPKLLMTVDQFADAVDKNRDLINVYGGGIKGLEEFGNQVSQVKSDLTYLGPAANDAALKFIQLSKSSGLVNKDTKVYQQNMNSMKKQFKTFAGMYGDSADDYENLMSAQLAEEGIQKKLNVLNDTQRVQFLDEIRLRTENLKALGLSNQQIVEFNKKLESIYDPSKVNITQKVQEGVGLQNSYYEGINTLANGTSEQQKKAEFARQNAQGIQVLSDALTRGASQEEIRKIMADPKVQQAMKAYAAMKDEIEQSFNENQAIGFKIQSQMAGSMGSYISSEGTQLNTAGIQGRNLLGDVNNPNDRRRYEGLKTRNELDLRDEYKIDKNGNKVKSDLATTLDAETTAIMTVTNALNNPFVKAIEAAIAALGAFALSLGASSLGNILGKGGGILGKGGGVGGTLGKLGKGAGKLGVVGAIIGAGVTAKDMYDEYQAYEGGKITDTQRNTKMGKSVGGFAGGLAGAEAGSMGGAALGTMIFPGVGTAIGGAIGGLAGGVAGYYGGDFLGGWLGSKTGTGKLVGGNTTYQQTQESRPTASQNQMPLNGGNPQNVEERKRILEKALDSQKITDPTERAAFMAQLDHETGGFRFMRELSSGKQYEGRRDLGNVYQGDGEKYKGRGYIQLTGRNNYKKYGDMIGQDLINHPELAEDPAIASQIAIAYWRDKRFKNGDSLADRAKAGNFNSVTRGVNGGFVGKQDRDSKYSMYLAKYGATNLPKSVQDMQNSRQGSALLDAATVNKMISIASTTDLSQGPIQLDSDTLDKMATIVQESNSGSISIDDASLNKMKQILASSNYQNPTTMMATASKSMSDSMKTALATSDRFNMNRVVQPQTVLPPGVSSVQQISQPQAAQQVASTNTVQPVISNNVPTPAVDQLNELKKQTEILSTIARNTSGTFRVPTHPGAYQLDRATILNGLG